MAFDSIIGDLDDDPDGSVLHWAEHGVTKEEVEEVFENVTDVDISRSAGRPVAFGDTHAGRHLMVVDEEIDQDTVYPVTHTMYQGSDSYETYYTPTSADA